MYKIQIVSIRGWQIALRLVPEHPDRTPYYVSPEFAAATLWFAGGALANEYPDDAFAADMAAGKRKGSDFVSSLTINNVHGFPWTFEASQTAADYVITTTDERWIAGIATGHRFESYAHCQNGAFLSAVKPDAQGRPMAWWFAGADNVRPKRVIRDLDVLQMLKNAGIE